MGTCAANSDTFELPPRDSQVTEAMFFRSASRNTSSSVHRFIDTMRVGLDAPSAAGASAAADSTVTAMPSAWRCCIGPRGLRPRARTVGRPASARSSVGQLQAGVDGQPRSIEAGRVLVLLVEQIVDTAEGLDILVNLVLRRQV